MLTVANRYMSQYRGAAGVDSYGDPLDDNTTPHATRVPVTLTARRAVTTRADDDRPASVRYYTMRVPAGYDVQDGDRWRDERTDEVFYMEDHDQNVQPVTEQDTMVNVYRDAGSGVLTP